MTVTHTQTLALTRERTNKHTVRFSQRGCDESATSPCPSVTLPKDRLERLGLAEEDELFVTVYATRDGEVDELTLVQETEHRLLEAGHDLGEEPLLFHATVAELGDVPAGPTGGASD